MFNGKVKDSGNDVVRICHIVYAAGRIGHTIQFVAIASLNDDGVVSNLRNCTTADKAINRNNIGCSTALYAADYVGTIVPIDISAKLYVSSVSNESRTVGIRSVVAAHGDYHVAHTVPFKSGVELECLPIVGEVAHIAAPYHLESFGILDKSIRKVLSIGVGQINLAVFEIAAAVGVGGLEL